MPKKLIEVALPLEAINEASAREGYIYKGNPSAVHKWWAQRPFAAARAVLFAQLVDDPSTWPELQGDEPRQREERKRLFGMIENFVEWEDGFKESRIRAARCEIARSHARFRRGASKADRMLADDVTPAEVNEYLATELPPVHDPFAGGGTIPLEAQRLGLRAIASDLNPVAVFINKALIEIPPKFTGLPPVHPGANTVKKDWRGAEGLADDVRYYGKWMRDEAFKRIGQLYPKVQPPKEQGGESTVITWLWARTVKCPNPGCGAITPLARSFVLSTKKGREQWAEPVVDHQAKTVRFEVRAGVGGDKAKGTVDRRGARCLVCGEGVPLDHVREEGRAGRMAAQMMAIVAEGKKGRIYLSRNDVHERVAASAKPGWVPDAKLPEQALGFRVQNYGMTTWASLYTTRQIAMMAVYVDLIRGLTRGDFHPNLDADRRSAIGVFLACSISKVAEYNCTLVPWFTKEDRPKGVFARHALPIVWDYAEVNPFADLGGSVSASVTIVADAMSRLGMFPTNAGLVVQANAVHAGKAVPTRLISTDPPYYDNVPYADLSDFFYVWLRRGLGDVFPELFGTMVVPKVEELVADPFRHGGRDSARAFFEKNLFLAFQDAATNHAVDIPMTVYYAFKQSEENTDDLAAPHDQTASTGWETILAGLIDAGWSITGTWPIRTERTGRSRDIGSNALASSIVLVCRKRPDTAPSATRQEFLRALKRTLPRDLKLLQQGNIAPVDFAQAAIGPGMAVFSSYARVLESDGTPLPVRTALQLINQVLDEVLSEQEGEFDADTRCAVAWFEQHQYGDGEFGSADTLARAKNTSVAGLVEAGVLHASRGKVRLRTRAELDAAWDPATDARCTVWEVTQHLIRAQESGGEAGAAKLLARVGSRADAARDLAYRLYSLCERKKWAQEAMGYNALVTAWPELTRLAAAEVSATPAEPAQGSLKGMA